MNVQLEQLCVPRTAQTHSALTRAVAGQASSSMQMATLVMVWWQQGFLIQALISPLNSDIDECGGDHMCEVACNNTAGSFHCACMPGYVLNSDERTCRGEEKTRPCPLWKINILNFSQIWMSVLLVWTCVTRIASTLLALTHAAATVHTHSTTMASDAMVCK